MIGACAQTYFDLPGVQNQQELTQKLEKSMLQMEHLQQHLMDSQKLHEQSLRSLHQEAAAQTAAAAAAKAAADACLLEAGDKFRAANGIIAKLQQQLQEQLALHAAEVEQLEVMLAPIGM